MDCTYGPIEAAVQVANHAPASVEPGTVLALYAEDADGERTELTSTSLPELDASWAASSVVLTAPPPLPDGTVALVAVVDPHRQVEECSDRDNEARVEVSCE